MVEKLILTGLFLVKFVDVDGPTKNILLEQIYPNTGNMVAWWDKDFSHKEGDQVEFSIKAECTRVYEILEGNGKRGSPWAAEDDWYLNRRPYICNAEEVKE